MILQKMGRSEKSLAGLGAHRISSRAAGSLSVAIGCRHEWTAQGDWDGTGIGGGTA
jgi:hypothetical protein